MKITFPEKVDSDYTVETQDGNILIPASFIAAVDNVELDVPLILKLIAAARHARERAYSPYSHFKVGAAVVMADDPDVQIFTGNNIENASYSVSLCAERSALSSGVSAGFRKVKYLAIATSSEDSDLGTRAPCGSCRQFLAEFALDADKGEGTSLVFLANDDDNIIAEMLDIDRLLPHRFTFRPE